MNSMLIPAASSAPFPFGMIILIVLLIAFIVYFINKNLAKSGKNKLSLSEINWTQIAKIVNIVFFIVIVISGFIFGATTINDILYYAIGVEGLGVIVGGLGGIILGGVLISMSMVIIEISQKLSAILKELKNYDDSD